MIPQSGKRATRRVCSRLTKRNFALAAFDWQDPFDLESRLTEDERMVRDSANAMAQEYLYPMVKDQWLNETVHPEIFKRMGEVGLLGATIDGYGCSGVSQTAGGLICREIERVDSGYRSMLSVQSSLVMLPIHEYGQESLKSRLLPELAAGEKIGCMGLTEPAAGSDPAGMKTKAVKTKGGYLLSGEKMWISNSPIADVFIVWAKNEDGVVGGYVLERGEKGLETPKIANKVSLRSSITGSIVMNNVFCPDENVLSVKGMTGPFSLLNSARFGIAWGTIGAAEDCFHKTVAYTMDRKQFSYPLSSYQLVQYKFAEMMTDITLAMESVLTASRAKEAGTLHPTAISIIKRNSCLRSLDIARKCRDILGGNGIIADYDVIRHMVNLETVNTYEGTADVHALILGRAITGIQAFSHTASHDPASKN